MGRFPEISGSKAATEMIALATENVNINHKYD
jgi:hypothetical protein